MIEKGWHKANSLNDMQIVTAQFCMPMV